MEGVTEITEPVIEIEKVSPPRERQKRGRKPGQKTGTGKSSSLFRKRRADAKITAKENPNSAAAIEAIGAAPSDKTTPGEDAPGKRRAKTAAMSVASLAKSLQVLHAGLATITQCEDAKLSDAEADMLAKAFDAWADEYDVKVSNKAVVNVNLFGTLAIIEGRKLAAIRASVAAKAKVRQKDAAPSPANEPSPPPSHIFDADYFDAGQV